MQKALAAGAIAEPFTVHDLRAKSASDTLNPLNGGEATK
jgi:hypothetical protein